MRTNLVHLKIKLVEASKRTIHSRLSCGVDQAYLTRVPPRGCYTLGNKKLP